MSLGKKYFVSGLYVLLLVAGTARDALAHNGAIAYAEQLSQVTIDGDLSEWVAVSPLALLEDSQALRDHKVELRVAASEDGQSIYIALQYAEQSPTINPDATDPCDRQDCQLIYVDREHARSGSGVVAYLAGGGRHQVTHPHADWDPANSNASWDDIEQVSRHHDGVTTHEWKISLPGVGARSVGFDVFVYDYDDEEGNGAVYTWGPGFGKTANPYRLGDLVVGHRRGLGTLSGDVGWVHQVNKELPAQIRLTMQGNSRLYVDTALVDGRYEAALPRGEYVVESASSLTDPFRVDYNNYPLRIESQRVTAKVRKGRSSEAVQLGLVGQPGPEYLIAQQGMLGKLDRQSIRTLDTLVDSFRQYYGIPGCSYAIIQNGELLHSATFGERNSLTGEPLNHDTLLEGASLTKAMFAVLVHRLAQKDFLDLDKPLLDYLPFDNIDHDRRARYMTARHVLSHQSGLPNWAWGGPGGWQTGGNIELRFKPGAEFHYSGEAFNYLGRVIEEITSQPLAELLQEYVTHPAGMQDTVFAVTENEESSASIGHFQQFPVWRSRARFVSPASSVHSNAKDFTKFLAALVDGETYEDQVREALFTPVLEIPDSDRVTNDTSRQWMGQGFFIRETPLGRAVEHGGNNDDFDAKFAVYPATGNGYVIFTNSNVGDELIDILEQHLVFGRK